MTLPTRARCSMRFSIHPKRDGSRPAKGRLSFSGHPTGVIPEVDIVNPRPEGTVQVTRLTSDDERRGHRHVVGPAVKKTSTNAQRRERRADGTGRPPPQPLA